MTNIGNLTAMTYAYKYAAYAGINQGVLMTLNSLSAVYNIVIFYFLFKEKVNLIQSLGIGLMLGCVALLSLNGSSKTTLI